MNRSQFIKTGGPVIPSYDYFRAGGLHHTPVMQCDLSAGRLPRRDFLKIVGAGAAALALPGPVLAEISGASAAALPDFKNLAQTHDLPSLPDWGPYSKKYFGISHIPDIRRGLCFDCSIFPLLARGPAKLPSVMDQSGVHPWEASPDVNFYSLRTELIWKDQLYCDLSFFRSSGVGWLVRMELVNQTSDAHDISLNCLTQMVFPPVKELTFAGIEGRKFSALACMNPTARYQVHWNGRPAEFTTVHDGLLQIQLPRESKPGELFITHV